MSKTIWALTLLLAGSYPALAQSPPNLTPEQIAAARAEGDALLKAAHAEDLFDNETGDTRLGAIILRHRASGYRCLFNPGRAINRIDVARSLTRGDDVGCITQILAGVQELILTRAPEKTIEQALSEEAKVVKLNHPEAQPYTPKPSPSIFGRLGGASIPPPSTMSFRSASFGERILVGKIGDWLVIDRFYGGPQMADAGPVVDPFWTTTVLEGRRHAELANASGSPASAKPAETRAPMLDPRREADEIIERGNAADVFENVATDKLPALRHRLSGFVCTFEPGSPDNSVSVYPHQPRGSDVMCNTRVLGAIVSRFVTKLPIPVTVDQAFQGYLTEIKRTYPDMQPAPGAFGNASANKPGSPPEPARKTARLTYTKNGEKVFSRLSVAVVDGWIIEQRVTAPMKDAVTADLMGELSMMSDVDKMAGWPPETKPSGGST